MSVEKFPDPAPAERTPAEQAVWEKAVEACKEAIRAAHPEDYNLIRRGSDRLSWGYMAKVMEAFIDAACLPEPDKERLETMEVHIADALFDAAERTPAQQAAYEEGVKHAMGVVEDGLDDVTDSTLKSCLRTPIAMIIRDAIDAACLPEEEIEVTEAMVKVGVEALVCDPRNTLGQVEDVYRAMRRQRRAQKSMERQRIAGDKIEQMKKAPQCTNRN